MQIFRLNQLLFILILLFVTYGCSNGPDSTGEIVPDESNTTEISGQLFDSTGNPIVGAKVEIHSDPTIVYTDSQGSYRATIEKGAHHIKISIPIISDDGSTFIGEYTIFEKNFNTNPSTEEDQLPESIGGSMVPLDNEYYEGGVVCLKDSDRDGYSDASDIGVSITGDSCTMTGYFESNSIHWISISTDCDDTNSEIHPGATEVYDSIDNNCVAGIDENFIAYYADTDGDGYGSGIAVYSDTPTAGYVTVSTDCDDTNPAVNPGATEIYDGIDNNCVTGIDENFIAYYADTDGDGYGTGTAVYYDTPTAGYVTDSSDCDDMNPVVNPGATEIYDNIDNNCVAGIDENFIAYYADTDGDGYGTGTAVYYDTPAAGYVTDSSDCDDTNPAVNPGATELFDSIDNNCVGGVDENFIAYYTDADGDGYGTGSAFYYDTLIAGYVTVSSDCDDTNPGVNPGATEIYDGIDNNCVAGIDENFIAYYADADGDGYGIGAAVYYDTPTAGYVTVSSDCDDTNPVVNPVAIEIYDGIDNNCVAGIDENFIAYYADSDGDGYGAGTAVYYDTPTAGYVTTSTDCDDTNSDVNPGTTEVYDGIDNNCVNGIDENFIAYYPDADGDGYGAGTAVYYDTPTAGYVTTSTDCDDTNSDVNPGTTEVYDGIDNNCVNGVDENFIAYYADADGDGYGAGTAVYYDTPTAGYVTTSTDCDDTNSGVNPGTTEVYDGIDNNCVNGIDENFTAYYADTDGDGFGAGPAVYYDTPTAGFVTDTTDCDDTNSAVNPGAQEITDGIDNNCDGSELISTHSATIAPGASGVLELIQ